MAQWTVHLQTPWPGLIRDFTPLFFFATVSMIYCAHCVPLISFASFHVCLSPYSLTHWPSAVYYRHLIPHLPLLPHFSHPLHLLHLPPLQPPHPPPPPPRAPPPLPLRIH